jgi:hypothetical protein
MLTTFLEEMTKLYNFLKMYAKILTYNIYKKVSLGIC